MRVRASNPDPYRDALLRRVVRRARLGFGVFLACVAISTLFEVLRFPERRVWMAGFAAGFVLLVVLASAAIRRRRAWSVATLIVFVNVVGVAVNAYHVIVHASLPMCVWQLTALLGSAAVILPWGARSQAIACVGALVSYPLHLVAGTADPLVWSAGGTYLAAVSALSVFGASRFADYVRSGLRLTAQLSEREARLQSYFDLALVGTAILASDGGYIEVNDELCTMFGYARSELLHLSWRVLFLPADRAAFAALVRRMLSQADDPERREMRCVRKDGTILDAIVSVRGLPGAHGTIDHLMLVVQDITERRRAEAERERYLVQAEAARLRAEEASRAKDEFLATVSHELRTPLTPILAWANLLRKGALDLDKTTAALDAIEQSARTQAQLIEDLLDVARIVSGEWRLTLGLVDVTHVVRAALALVQPAADAKGLTIVAALPDGGIGVRGDADRLKQVVWNLVANAVKFTPPGGRVDVAATRGDSTAALVVRDTGEGIDPAFLPHVFERFRQADSSSTREQGGLGLGLAIVRALVELHGGSVRAESPGRHRGAVFTVTLPLAGASDRPAPALPQTATSVASLGGVHVLVVDDDPGSNAVVSALVTACGGEARTAASTSEALEIAGRWRPDVLVSDLAMPGEDGYALLRKLRARDEAFGRIPAIALTAYAGTADRRRSLAAGFAAYIAKPFDPSELAAAVRDAASRARPV